MLYGTHCCVEHAWITVHLLIHTMVVILIQTFKEQICRQSFLIFSIACVFCLLLQTNQFCTHLLNPGTTGSSVTINANGKHMLADNQGFHFLR